MDDLDLIRLQAQYRQTRRDNRLPRGRRAQRPVPDFPNERSVRWVAGADQGSSGQGCLG